MAFPEMLSRAANAKSKKIFAITNAKVILPDRIVARGSVVVKGKKIAAIRKSAAVAPGAIKINARGNFVAPGFIDLHIHGDIPKVSRQQVRGGTTGFLATLHPAKPQTLLRNIQKGSGAFLPRPGAFCAGAKVLGLRLEGPFLNRQFCGALPKQALRQPDLAEAARIIRRAGRALKMVVVAPELKGALKLIRLFKKHGIIASLGHTAAAFKEAKKAIGAGVNHATHTFNRMRGFVGHDCGALGAVLTDARVTCEVIADGIHVHPCALRLLLACKGLDKIILITDSTAAQKYPPKKRAGRIFRLPDGTLYGTALTLNRALKKVIRLWNLNLVQAVKLVSLNPARLLKIARSKGSIAVGKDADLVIFDKNLNIKMTIVEGNIVYKP